MNRQEVEELVGPIGDWQWRIIKDFMPGGSGRTQLASTPRWQGKQQHLEILMDLYERLGWRVEKTDLGWAIWDGEEC